jgi:hypothetical protein
MDLNPTELSALRTKLTADRGDLTDQELAFGKLLFAVVSAHMPTADSDAILDCLAGCVVTSALNPPRVTQAADVLVSLAKAANAMREA